MRYHFSLFVVFSVGALVLAAPTSVNKEDVKPGQIYWPRLKYMQPKDPGVQALQGKQRDNAMDRNHPVIVVSDVDAHDKVKVAAISTHPLRSGWRSVHSEPASNYADLIGSINVGPPKTVKVARLKPPRNGVEAVRPGRLQPLIDRINANCPADKKLAGCEPSGSAQGNTVHGTSEHDHPKQLEGSQKSSSNKGSSSQGSRPGSQSSQESSSSQGSQLGGSSQGSPPGSSDDGGWQVVAGSRRSNKARSKQLEGSQKSSSNKGSSSQGSRPGSPKQSSQESSSSQGSQLGSSKQGSPPGSSHDGWQVVAGGRRSNKARGSRNK